MALQNVEANITLDLYNHDTTPATVKAIQLDSQTRYVAARLQNVGVQYDVDSEATVQLIVVRPDKVGVQITGTTFTYGDESSEYLGPYAELTQVALAVSGKMRGQFKITSGTQILRTEIFAINNGEALDASTDEWADEYDGYDLAEMATSIETNAADIAALEADVSQIREDFTYKVNSAVIYCDDLEDGWYSNNNGQKYPNTESSSFKRSKNLIPVEEGALYVGDRTTRCTCFDKNGTFLTYITVYASTEKFARQTIPTGTTHVGLTATNAPSFTLTKVDASGVTGIEYPYNSKGCVHVESCWCNANGGVYSTSNLDMLVIPVEEGERWYVSNQADSNLLCLDGTGAMVSATYEARSPIGKVVTVPSGAKLMYVNLYHANTKGVNNAAM